MSTVSSLFESMKKSYRKHRNSYKEHRARGHLDRAVRAALGSRIYSDSSGSGKTTSQQEQYVINSLTLMLDPNNSYQRYPVLSTQSIHPHSKNSIGQMTLVKGKDRLKEPSGNHLLFFPAEDGPSQPSSSLSPNKVLLNERKAEFNASQVYYRNIPQDAVTLGCTFRTLKLVVAMDNYFNLSKLPSSSELILLMKNQNFVNTYHHLVEPDSNLSRVSFDEVVHTKVFDASELPMLPPITSKSSDQITKTILKNHINQNFSKECELSLNCDKIDSGMFIQLVDMSLKKKVKQHCISKLLRNYTIQ